MSMDSEDFKVLADKKINLKDYDSGWVPKWAKKREETDGKKAVKKVNRQGTLCSIGKSGFRRVTDKNKILKPI